MKRLMCLFVGLFAISIALGNRISSSQYLLADDLVEKPPVHHDVHLQAPNGQQSRVIVLGPADLSYSVQVSVLVGGQEHRQEKCEFQFESTPENQIPTCIIDFSDKNEVKKINLNQKSTDETIED